MCWSQVDPNDVTEGQSKRSGRSRKEQNGLSLFLGADLISCSLLPRVFYPPPSIRKEIRNFCRHHLLAVLSRAIGGFYRAELLSPRRDGLCQLRQHGFTVFPVDASICDGHAVLETGLALSGDLLVALVDV